MAKLLSDSRLVSCDRQVKRGERREIKAERSGSTGLFLPMIRGKCSLLRGREAAGT